MKKEDHNAIPDSVLTKEFLSQFKTEDDVSKFLTKLHAQVLEKMLESISGMRRTPLPATTVVTPATASTQRRYRPSTESLSSPCLATVTASLSPLQYPSMRAVGSPLNAWSYPFTQRE